MSYAISMAKGFAPAAERNRQPILDVLRRVLPSAGLVLEVASGTGQHANFFSEHLPALRWQPTDASPDALQTIRAWVDETGRDNLLPPLELDVRSPQWPVATADALLCINMIHISPWETTEALFRGASKLLVGGSPWSPTARIGSAASTRRRATRHSTKAFALATRAGAFVISMSCVSSVSEQALLSRNGLACQLTT